MAVTPSITTDEKVSDQEMQERLCKVQRMVPEICRMLAHRQDQAR